MWVTQTYLSGPRTTFPLYVYALFNPYTDWNGPQVQTLKALLARFGRQTGTRAAAFVPGDGADYERIGDELDHRFWNWVQGRLNRAHIQIGLLLVNRQLEDVDDEAREARWAFFRFDNELQLLGESVQLQSVLPMIEDAALRSDDPVQESIILVGQSTRRRQAILDAVSLSAVGVPSVNLGAITRALADTNYLETNIYD